LRPTEAPLPPEVKSATLGQKTLAPKTTPAAAARPAEADSPDRAGAALGVTRSRSPTIGPTVTELQEGEPSRRRRREGGFTIRGIKVDQLGPTATTLSDPGPLLLLPLRLEYRLVPRAQRPTVVDFTEELQAFETLDRQRSSGPPSSEVNRLRERRKITSAILSKAPTTKRLTLTGTQELWFRWYPDESFSTKGIAPPTAAETEALNRFLNVVGGRPWYDPVDADAMAAWQSFAAAVGPYRAIHLVRSRPAAIDGRYEENIGRIAVLPSKVTLFAVTASTVEMLASGAAIPPNASGARSQVSYTPEAIQPGGWLRDFPLAEKLGMGLRITDAGTITKALGADHIIAVGNFADDAKAELTNLLSDTIANGVFEFLRQDTATNNGPGAPSGLVDPRKDLAGFLKIATQSEAGLLTDGSQTAADLLAEALGIDHAVARMAVQAADTPFTDAKAMLRVVGPAILDGALDGTTVIEGIDENEFIDVLAAACCARGPLSAMRFANNPFGILPITTVRDLAIDDPDPNTASVQTFLKAYAAFAREGLPQYAERVVPVLQPQDPQAAGKIEALLKTNRISRRIDVADAGSSTTAPIGCPYVADSRPQDSPAAYLASLRTSRLSDLPDPTDSDTSTPLLYRLARLTLTRNVTQPVITALQPVIIRRGRGVFHALEQDPVLLGRVTATGVLGRSAVDLASGRGVTGIDRSAILILGRLNANFVAAIAQLERVAARPQGVAELETLLVEVIDLLQHRVDALATGLAYARLARSRQAKNTALHAGYFGFLGKLRPASVTGSSDGFIQAPSMAQATTAALLRSAYLRHKANGAFEIDLSSRRVRRALALLDVLKKGLPLEEALGLRGERWLHDNRLSRLTFDLRRVFPFVNVTPPESRTAQGTAAPQPAGVRAFDGLKFIDGALTAFKAADRPQLQNLKTILADDLDALSDVVVAEAVHRRALGQAEAAKAWLNTLSGSPVPGDPVFLRTQRHGQGSTYRISFLAPNAATPTNPSPRQIVEPGLAATAGQLLPNFSTLAIVVTIARVDDPARRHQISIRLAADLGMQPIDLVIGGTSELQVRARFHVISAWLVDPAISNAVGLPVAEGLIAFINGTVTIAVTDSPSGPSVTQAITQAGKLRSLLQKGRMLEPSDLNAAASPATPLQETQEVALIADTVDKLRARVLALRTRLDTDIATLADAQAKLMLDVRDARRRLDVNGKDPALLAVLSSAEQRRRTLHRQLARAAGYSEPTALRAFTVEEAIANPDATDETLTALVERLRAKSAGLMAAHADTAAPALQRADDARARRRRLVEALQAALDGVSLPILPPIPRTTETTPLLDNAQTPASALGVWTQARPLAALATEIAAGLADVRAHPVAARATEDDPDPDDKDPRPEEVAPRARHFGTFLARADAIAAPAYAGFVCDEWAEQRPSRTQLAAMAVNYDSPQGEPPQCLLLCVPPNAGLQSWTENRAAEMVFEAIQWMKVRALSTDDKPWPASLLPRANQIAFNGSSRRIPQRRFRFADLAFTGFEGEFVVADNFPAGEALGLNQTDINETTGFHPIKE
jgi:hypothetical protein